MLADHQKSGYEKKDVNLIKVLLVTTVSTLILIISVIGLDQFFKINQERVFFERQMLPESSELRQQKLLENEVLNNYKIISASQGVYQIPITRAIDRLLEENGQ